jgi:hypothetical protein
MSHYYDKWNSTVSRGEILKAIASVEDDVARRVQTLAEVESDLKKDISRYTKSTMEFKITDLKIYLRENTKKLENLRKALQKKDRGEKVTGWDID